MLGGLTNKAVLTAVGATALAGGADHYDVLEKVGLNEEVEQTLVSAGVDRVRTVIPGELGGVFSKVMGATLNGARRCSDRYGFSNLSYSHLDISGETNELLRRIANNYSMNGQEATIATPFRTAKMACDEVNGKGVTTLSLSMPNGSVKQYHIVSETDFYTVRNLLENWVSDQL